MSPRHKFFSGGAQSVGERQIRVLASTAEIDRMGDIMMPEGCKLDNYRKNPVVLFSHDPKFPIGMAYVSITQDGVAATITFAPEGISETADQVCGLYKSGVLSGVSIGFDPIEWEPLRGGGQKYTKWDLLEISCVSIPANTAALVIERSFAGRAPKAANRLSAAPHTPAPPSLTPRQLAARATSTVDFMAAKRAELDQTAQRAYAALDAAPPTNDERFRAVAALEQSI